MSRQTAEDESSTKQRTSEDVRTKACRETRKLFCAKSSLGRNREAFERARDLKVVAFDKAGTLTEGKFGVRSVYTNTMAEDEALLLAAALEGRSEHPLAKAVVEEADTRSLDTPDVRDFEVVAGKGVAGTVNGTRTRYRIGRPEWIEEQGLS